MSAVAALIQTELNRHVIAEFVGDPDGPTLIAVGSIHGNEPSGRLALERLSGRLGLLKKNLRGRVYLLLGNRRASEVSARFIDCDLNRHWTRENILNNTRSPAGFAAEDAEQHDLLVIFREILKSARDEVYVLDLHTTSAGGAPFATVGDTLRNRRFAQMFPVTILLGIEEQLEGTMLEFLNNEGAVTLGFEAGQHEADTSIDNHESLVWLALVNSGILSAADAPDLEKHRQILKESTGNPGILEIRYRHAVSESDEFEMRPGFANFDRVKRGQLLATTRSGPVLAPETGCILMPLYQRQGEDGFFIARKVARIWLLVSETLRRAKIGDIIHRFPGIRRHPKHPEKFQVDTKIARFFPLQIFHLLGFRRLRLHNNFMLVTRRRHDTVSPFTEGRK